MPFFFSIILCASSSAIARAFIFFVLRAFLFLRLVILPLSDIPLLRVIISPFMSFSCIPANSPGRYPIRTAKRYAWIYHSSTSFPLSMVLSDAIKTLYSLSVRVNFSDCLQPLGMANSSGWSVVKRDFRQYLRKAIMQALIFLIDFCARPLAAAFCKTLSS